MQVDVVTHLFNTVVSSSNFIKFIEEIKKYGNRVESLPLAVLVLCEKRA